MDEFSRIKGNEARSMVRLPRIGKIRLGIKKKSARTGAEYPVETDYFVCPEVVRKVYGDKPKSLIIRVPIEDENKFFRQFYACYGGNGRLKCIGNGDFADRRSQDGKSKERVTCPSPESCDFAKINTCKARSVFQFTIPAITIGGVFELSSGSINTDIDIRSGIEMARKICGVSTWVPMELSRQEMMIPDPETGKMQRHWPVRLIPSITMEQANEIRERKERILEDQRVYTLPSPQIEAPEEGKSVQIEELEVPKEQLQEKKETVIVDAETEQSKIHDSQNKDTDPVSDAVIETKGEESDKKTEVQGNGVSSWSPPEMGGGYGSYLKAMNELREQISKITGSDSMYYVELASATKDMPGGPFDHSNKIRKLTFMAQAFAHIKGVAVSVSKNEISKEKEKT